MIKIVSVVSQIPAWKTDAYQRAAIAHKLCKFGKSFIPFSDFCYPKVTYEVFDNTIGVFPALSEEIGRNLRFRATFSHNLRIL